MLMAAAGGEAEASTQLNGSVGTTRQITSSGHTSSYAITNAWDGSETNYFVSESACDTSTPWACTDMFIQWDFGESKKITGIKYLTHGTYNLPGTSRFYVSTTGAFAGEETLVHTGSVVWPGDTMWSDVLEFSSPGVGRYLKIVIDNLTGGYGDGTARMKEIALMEVVQPGAGAVIPITDGSVSAESEYNSNYLAIEAWDGITSATNTNRWLSANSMYSTSTGLPNSDPTWYQWEFDEDQRVVKVKMWASTTAINPRDVTFYTSSTGAFAGEETDCGSASFEDYAGGWTIPAWVTTPTSAKYFRMVIDSKNASAPAYTGAAEFQIYHSDD